MTSPSALDISARAPKKRPLSPHLTIYRPQLTSGMSIFQKITGIGLAGGLIVLVSWLVAIAMGPEAYATFTGYCTSPIGLLFFFGWTWALFYHLCNAVRFLLWSVGWCLSLKAIYASGYMALAASTFLTLGLWALILGERVFA
jgi:succinate dehydrogenase / fumarate reductase cytochrome b subunit